MKKEFLQQAYEAPEVEAIELKMENAITIGSCEAEECGGSDTPEVCPEECGMDDE